MDRPFISIITPVLNAEEQIDFFLEAVRRQHYPRKNYELIVIDNGSTDRTAQKIRSIQDVIFLERTDIQNPYAARNKGIAYAKGELLVLLDVNCVPLAGWLESGVKRLRKPGVDLVGGQVSFTFSGEETLGEWYDSLLFVDMEDLIKRGRSCAGGNLFFRREVVEKIGLFPETYRSGMDLYWTKKATNAGFGLVYEAGAEVRYPARKLKPLMEKVFRVGTGQPKIWLDNQMHPLKLMLLILYQFFPPGTKELKNKIQRRGKEEMYDHLLALWGIHYLQKIILSLGWTKGFFNYYASKS